MNTVLVTGATGFVGWHTARRLRAAGHRVRVLVRDAAKARRCLAPLGIDAADRVVGDMKDAGAVAAAIAGCDAVVHAAAAVSVTSLASFDDNAQGTRRVMTEACERSCQAVIFVSSLTAIFDPRGGRVTADAPLVRSTTRYGRSKAASDRIARELQQAGAPIAIVYPSGVIGPDDPGLSESVRAYRGFVRETIRAGATQFVDARDLAELHRQLLERRRCGRFVAAGHYFSWDALTALLEEISGATIRRIAAPGWLLRAGASLADRVSRLSGRSFPITREGIEIATRWRRVEDSPAIAELGVVWRDPRETLEDLLRWYLESGRLPARAVPRLAEDPLPPAARIG